MDKRKLKFKGGLHKNLIGSQTSSSSNLSQTKSLTEQLPRNNSVLLAGKIFSSQSKFIDEIFYKSIEIIKYNIYRSEQIIGRRYFFK